MVETKHQNYFAEFNCCNTLFTSHTMLTLAEICKFGECTVSSPNFVEGEKLLNSNHVLSCGKMRKSVDSHEFVAHCLETVKIFKLKGEINLNGNIKSFVCPCDVKSNNKCKHILAVLLYCYRNGIDKLTEFSREDLKNDENHTKKKLLEQQNNEVLQEQSCKAVKLKDHECYKKSYKGCDSIKLSEKQKKDIEKILNSYRNKVLINNAEAILQKE